MNSRVPPGAVAPWPMPDGLVLIEVNEYPLAYQDAGTGPPVVMVHGSLNDFRSWSLQVPVFAQRHRVLALSLRHHYPERWDGRGNDFAVSQHADDVAAFVMRMGLGKVHLIGHSRGGAVALTVARRHADLVRTLVLADPRGLETLLPDTPEAREMAAQLGSTFTTLHKNLANGDIDRAAREFVDSLGGSGAWERRAPELKQVFLDNVATAVDVGESPAITCADIARMEMPILLITGEHSPRRYGEMFAAMKTCSALIPDPVTIPGAAHPMHRDNASAFNAVVLAFLRSRG